MKRIILLLLLSLSSTFQFQLSAQADSTTLKTTLATNDARYFRVGKEVRRAYRKHHLTTTSDYLNPAGNRIGNPDLLTDSVYVKAYKNIAYKNSISSIKTERKVIVIAGVVIVGVVVGALLIIKLFVDALTDSISKAVF
jgi:hypothetical protein